MGSEEKKTEDVEAWVTVQLQPPPFGAQFAAFVEPQEKGGYKVRTVPVAFFLLQHLSYDDNDGEQLDSRVIPAVVQPTGELLELDGGRGGGPDHGFAGVGSTPGEAAGLGQAVVTELERRPGK